MRAAGIASAFCVAASIGAARADESVLSPKFGGSAALSARRIPAVVLFASAETDAANSYGSAGFKLRPFRPLGEDRFILIASAGGGSWRETGRLALNRESDSRKFGASVLAGTEFSIAGGSLGVFAGPEYFRETAADPRGLILRRERRFGARLQVDWWSQPTQTTLLTANLATGTAKRDIWGRVAFGWRLGPADSIWGFAGPEAGLYASPTTTKLRAGVHWSEFGQGGFRFRISAGVLKETARKAGPYLAIGGYRGF